VQTEPGQIEQVLMNLAINARDAMREGGTLTIRARIEPLATDRADSTNAQGPSVVLTVQDTGCGMTPEVLQHAFEPFFTTKETGKGTGLGLATAYGIVRQNRGTVSLDSAPDRGTTVTIRLPAVTAPAAAPRHVEAGGNALPGGSERVLLVEDQREVRRLTQRMLQHMGYQVEAWASPSEALAQYNPAERHVDLVLSDVAMPEMNGPEFVARLKERRDGGDGFAVVFMSGYAEDRLPRRNAMGPYERFLQKPFTVEQLSTVIHAALEGTVARAHRPEVAA
jgi:two-component system, cell cycle sensor histidine kinase and response regulator CckA